MFEFVDYSLIESEYRYYEYEMMNSHQRSEMKKFGSKFFASGEGNRVRPNMPRKGER